MVGIIDRRRPRGLVELLGRVAEADGIQDDCLDRAELVDEGYILVYGRRSGFLVHPVAGEVVEGPHEMSRHYHILRGHLKYGGCRIRIG